ncbi:MAG: diadenosine tetraphosphate hydrolase [Phycisphaeraceae bacterium]|nr:diadenosine tetraphosphate hydrolase [Phycisphaeraceae bacterium]
MHASQPVDPECIFCRIVSGTIPCHRLYEDEDVLGFLDVGPVSRGHALIIPKGHWATLDQVPADVAAAAMRVAPRLSRAIMNATGAEAWNVLQNNGKLAHQAVDHVHFHIIPRTSDAGLEIGWPSGSLGDEDAAALVAAIARGMN